jgi:proline iminopeptidase
MVDGGDVMFVRIAVVGTAISAAAAAAFVAARRGWRTWGVDPAEATRSLPGDELVADADAVDTRGIEIDGTPEEVWPWLVQMGYGRAGWYSYDSLDPSQPSAHEIVPSLQALAVGDVLPTYPGGGFVVKTIEPQRSLVLFLDRDLAEQQAAEHPLHEATPNVRATGRFMDAAASGDFAASWAFVLEPTVAGGTRLIERVRVRMEVPTGAPALLRPMFGFGAFVMIRRQMLGIRERVHDARTSVVITPEAVPLGV